jgi:FtsZ-interacting cell division protein ZipA
MRTAPFFLADAYGGTIMASWRSQGSAVRGIILVVGAIGLVMLLVLTWAVFFRKRRRRRKYHHEHHHSSRPDEVPEVLKDEEFPSPHERRRHRRHSRHKHRPRNPTLAETGGLPPIRPQGPPEPQP